MNYPCGKKHTICRLLSFIVALAMICGLFAGCSLLGGNKEPTEPDPGPNLADPPTTPVAPAPSTDPSSDAPTSGGEDKTNIAVVKEQVNVRSSPSSTSNVLSTQEAGEEVEVKMLYTVLTVQWASLKQGWVPASSLDMTNVSLEPETIGTPQNPDATEPSSATEPPKSPGNEGNGSSGNNNGGTNETGNGNAVVTASQLNIRKEPTTEGDNKVGSYVYGDRITITDTRDGWGKTSKGWVYLEYVYRDGDTGSNGCSGVVTATQLIKRAGPGKKYDNIGSLNKGDKVKVLQRVTIGGTDWGYVTGGWICMDYVDTGDSSDNNNNNGTATGNGTVTAEGGLHIRSGPGTDYDSVGGLKKGDRVNITEQKDGWGRIAEGWISMKYVKMD